MLEIIGTNAKVEAVEQSGSALNKIILSKKTEVLLLSSGGSAIELLDRVDDAALPLIDTLAMLDERFTFDSSLSNYFKIYDTNFYHKAVDYGTPFFSALPSKGETLEECARRFSVFLHEWEKDHPRGRVIATMGIGKDGHTAGIFPRSKGLFDALFEKDEPVVGYTEPNAPEVHERLTVTNSFLRKIEGAVVLCCGKEKQEAIKRTLAQNGELSVTPARIIHEMRGVILCSDVLQYSHA